MCGIAGYLTEPGAPVDRALLRAMCDRLAHRGPDGAGYWQDQEAALGHRRLSIIDLSGGAQPLGNEDGSVQVSFNGEIYNYVELRHELLEKGHRFRTNSDTEVLVHLWEEEGERMPERLNGMYAFAIWDARRREMFLARDRFGKKPLYYSTAVPGLRFCFASELKSMAMLPGFDDQVCAEAVADYLTLNYVPEPRTIWKSVEKLPAAHSLLATRSGVKLRRYWRLEFAPEQGTHNARTIGQAAEEVRHLAADAVERRMISDVPLGAFLSGGVDSSSVVGMMSERAPDRVKTFSIGFTSKQYNELDYARVIAKRYRTEHHEEVVTPDIDEMFDPLVEHFDEPFADSSAVPMMYLSRMTRRHVTVALSGDGADEVFAGYRLYYFGVLESRLRHWMPRWFRRSVVRVAGKYYPKLDFLPQVFRAKSLLTNVSKEIGEAHFASRSNFTREGLRRLLTPGFERSSGGYWPGDSMVRLFERVRELPPLEQMQAVDIETWLPGDILVKADRATMAYSLEGRAPYLDYRLAELAARLPSGYKIAGRDRKHVFKRAVSGYVPDELLYRPKMGFSVPMPEWMRTRLKRRFESLVLRPEMERYIEAGEVKRLWDEHQSGLWDHSRKLWALLMLAAWDRRWAAEAAASEREGAGLRAG